MKHILTIQDFLLEYHGNDPIPRAESAIIFAELIDAIKKRRDVLYPIKSVNGYDIIWPCVDPETAYQRLIIRLVPIEPTIKKVLLYNTDGKGFYGETVHWKIIQIACLNGPFDELHLEKTLHSFQHLFVNILPDAVDKEVHPETIMYDTSYINNPNIYDEYYENGLLRIKKLLHNRNMKSFTRQYFFPKKTQVFIDRSIVFFDVAWMSHMNNIHRKEYVDKLTEYYINSVLPIVYHGDILAK